HKMHTMDSSNVKHRTKDERATTADGVDAASTATATPTEDEDVQQKAKRQSRIASAKRGLRSLSVAVAIPFCLTLANIYLFGNTRSAHGTTSAPTKSWAPPLLALHAACLASASLMGLSAWIVWAEGGFHRDPAVLVPYLCLLGLGLAWDPVVFWLGANWAGLAVAAAAAGAILRWSAVARRVNPMAADLIMPCLAWTGFLAFVNLKLLLSPDP
ncbi:hypothetical protein Dimus_034693, partial [Dionaea muscipula]